MRHYNDTHPSVTGVGTKSSGPGLKSSRGQSDTTSMS